MSSALAVNDVSHSFGDRKALDGVGFAIQPGDFTVLLGLNGAGKTTLFALVTGLYHSRDGSIAVYGDDLRKRYLKALARIGAVFQQSTLDLDLTVEQNLFYHASLHGMGSPARSPRRASPQSSSASASPTAAGTAPANCRAASAAGSSWPGR